MRLIAVDDEQDTLEEIRALVAETPGLTMEQTYINPIKALEELDAVKPDGVFVDIEMPGMNGIDLAERILSRRPETDIVFITAFNHYATEAFEVNALDYVLKPIHPERFSKVINKMVRTNKASRMVGKTVIQSLGAMEVLQDGQPIRWNRAKAKELFAYLLHHAGVKQNKFRISEALWPETDPKRALVNLQTAVCSLRKNLASLSESEIQIIYTEDCYLLHIKAAAWDAKVFEDMYKQAQSAADTDSIKAAIAQYQGDYFSSEDWDWAMLATQNMARKYEHLLEMLADSYFHHSQFHEAAQTLLSLLKRRPLSGKQQVLFLKAAQEESGLSGLLQQAKLLGTLCRAEYDADLEPEAIMFLKDKVKML